MGAPNTYKKLFRINKRNPDNKRKPDNIRNFKGSRLIKFHK